MHKFRNIVVAAIFYVAKYMYVFAINVDINFVFLCIDKTKFNSQIEAPMYCRAHLLYKINDKYMHLLVVKHE